MLDIPKLVVNHEVRSWANSGRINSLNPQKCKNIDFLVKEKYIFKRLSIDRNFIS